MLTTQHRGYPPRTVTPASVSTAGGLGLTAHLQGAVPCFQTTFIRGQSQADIIMVLDPDGKPMRKDKHAIDNHGRCQIETLNGAISVKESHPSQDALWLDISTNDPQFDVGPLRDPKFGWLV